MTELTKNVSNHHLKSIFSLYGPSFLGAHKEKRDYSRAFVTYSNRKDAMYALDHLMSRNKKSVIDGREIEVKFVHTRQSNP